MTIASEAPTLNTPVQVRFTHAGTPLAIRHDGQIRSVDLELDTAHWYTRDSWWETRQAIPAGTGNVVDIEHWQVQVRLPGPGSPLRTFQLRREPLTQQWFLDTITHAD